MKRCASTLQACGGSVELQWDRRRFTHVMRSADNSDPADPSLPGGRLPRRGVQGAWEFNPEIIWDTPAKSLTVRFGTEEL